MVSIQQQLLQAARVSKYFFWNAGKRAMSFVDELDLPIAAFKYWNALEHFHYNSNESIDNLLFCARPRNFFLYPTTKHYRSTHTQNTLYFVRFFLSFIFLTQLSIHLISFTYFRFVVNIKMHRYTQNLV